jgi:hypothetical protein
MSPGGIIKFSFSPSFASFVVVVPGDDGDGAVVVERGVATFGDEIASLVVVFGSIFSLPAPPGIFSMLTFVAESEPRFLFFVDSMCCRA